jgi:uncharacterized protein (TIGR02246 family)
MALVRSTLWATILQLWLGACGAVENPHVDTAAEEQKIRAVVAEWSKAAEAGDAATFASFYAPDGVIKPPNARPVRGEEMIEVLVRQAFSSSLWASFSTTEIKVAQAGDVAYDVGTYRMTIPTADGAIEDEGKYVVVWRKANGEWKARVHIYNSSKPA